MKSKLEILREVVAERLRHVSVMGKIGVSAGFEAEGTASAVRIEQLQIMLDDILFAEAAPDADDPGAALAERDQLRSELEKIKFGSGVCAAERDESRSMLIAADTESARLRAERDTLKAALATVEGERDTYKAALVQMRSNLRSRDVMVELATEALA